VDDPIEILGRWIEDARRAGVRAPAAMSLATATIEGQPSLRMVSLKRLSGEGLVFTSGLLTRKVKELIANPRVAATFYWQELGRQARIEGLAGPVAPDLAVELFAERPRSHQLQAHVSKQGEEIDDLDALRDRLETIDAELGEAPVPCPDNWGAIRIVPNRVELWEEAPDRLHERLLFEAGDGGWRRSLLAP
jgi:pyridoxamine 5'-phosphate oxidase